MTKKIIVGIKKIGFVMLVPKKMYAVSPGITPRSVPSIYHRNGILVTPNPKLTKSNGNRGTIRKNNTVIKGDSLIDPSSFFNILNFSVTFPPKYLPTKKATDAEKFSPMYVKIHPKTGPNKTAETGVSIDVGKKIRGLIV